MEKRKKISKVNANNAPIFHTKSKGKIQGDNKENFFIASKARKGNSTKSMTIMQKPTITIINDEFQFNAGSKVDTPLQEITPHLLVIGKKQSKNEEFLIW